MLTSQPITRSEGITEIGRLGRETGVESRGLGGWGERGNLKSEGGVGRQAVGEGISREDAKVIIFQNSDRILVSWTAVA
jgi:hypothetical protein